MTLADHTAASLDQCLDAMVQLAESLTEREQMEASVELAYTLGWRMRVTNFGAGGEFAWWLPDDTGWVSDGPPKYGKSGDACDALMVEQGMRCETLRGVVLDIRDPATETISCRIRSRRSTSRSTSSGSASFAKP